MLLAIQIAGFSNQLFSKDKLIKQPNSLYVGINSQKLKADRKILVGHGQKLVWPIWPLGSKIDCISKIN